MVMGIRKGSHGEGGLADVVFQMGDCLNQTPSDDGWPTLTDTDATQANGSSPAAISRSARATLRVQNGRRSRRRGLPCAPTSSSL